MPKGRQSQKSSMIQYSYIPVGYPRRMTSMPNIRTCNPRYAQLCILPQNQRPQPPRHDASTSSQRHPSGPRGWQPEKCFRQSREMDWLLPLPVRRRTRHPPIWTAPSWICLQLLVCIARLELCIIGGAAFSCDICQKEKRREGKRGGIGESKVMATDGGHAWLAM